MDKVFRAMADPTRRRLLDALFEEDGQTLGALEGRFRMTRFGVMKHLRVLEEAGLVVTKRLAICVVSLAICLTFTCNDALFHTNRPVRPDEGKCEIVQEGARHVPLQPSRPCFGRALEPS